MADDRKSPKDATATGGKPSRGKGGAESPAADQDVTPDPATGIKPDTFEPDTVDPNVKMSEAEDTPASAEATDAMDDAEEAPVEQPADETPASEERQTINPPPAPAPVIVRRGGFWPMVLGGAVAAGLGAGAMWYWGEYGAAPADDLPQAVAELRAGLDDQSGRIDTLAGQVETLEAGSDDAETEEALRADLGDLAGRIDALQSEVAALRDRPTVEGSLASDSDLAALSQRIEAQASEIAALTQAAEEREAAANASAQATLRRAALTRVQTALDTGSNFSAALADLEATGQEVPQALRDVAESGVPEMAELQEGFAPAARDALAAARASAEGTGDFWSFMGDQLGVRSLEPREGSDPDAVLSRAEAALRDGRLADALAEIETLPPGAGAAMQDWSARARARAEAVQAAESLAAQLN